MKKRTATTAIETTTATTAIEIKNMKKTKKRTATATSSFQKELDDEQLELLASTLLAQICCCEQPLRSTASFVVGVAVVIAVVCLFVCLFVCFFFLLIYRPKWQGFVVVDVVV